MRVAVLVKQVPALAELALGPDGRLLRDGLALELNPYCRRAVAKGVELGTCVVFTLGPPAAADALREAVAWGAERGVLVTDPAFAGSDTLATARALAAALRREGPFDLILTGRNSVDADTGQLAPQLAELLDLPYVGPARTLDVVERTVRARCERDDGYADASVVLPAVVSAAERLCAPAKVPPDGRAAVPADRITVVSAADLGPGPWGAAGSPTSVGRTRLVALDRRRLRGTGTLTEQVRQAADALRAQPPVAVLLRPQRAQKNRNQVVAVVAEPDRERATRELLGAAAALGGRPVLLASHPVDARTAWRWGADELVTLRGADTPEDEAAAIARWCAVQPAGRRPSGGPWAVLASSTCHGREVAARVAARLGAGLTGDAVELERDGERLVCWKPAFGGQLLAAITASSAVQLATVRPGALPLPERRTGSPAIAVTSLDAAGRARVSVGEVTRDDDPDALALARAVVGVGQGIDPADYPDLKPLLEVLDAELGATRKVTDLGWQPRSRQIGITGQSIAPDLYVALAVHGKLTHLAGVRGAGFVLAINADPDAPVFEGADFGIVADWREVVHLLVRELSEPA